MWTWLPDVERGPGCYVLVDPDGDLGGLVSLLEPRLRAWRMDRIVAALSAPEPQEG